MYVGGSPQIRRRSPSAAITPKYPAGSALSACRRITWSCSRLCASAGSAAWHDLQRWQDSHPAPEVTLAEVVAHLDHAREVAGVAHVGLGGDYDGVPALPAALRDVSTYPALLAALADDGWSAADLEALTWGNAIRVLR